MGKTRFSERFRERIPEFSRNKNWFDIAAFACQDLFDVLDDHGIKVTEFCNIYLKKGYGMINPNLFSLGLPYDAEKAWDEDNREEDDFSVIHDIAHILEKCEGRTVEEELRKELEVAAAMFEAKEDQMKEFLHKPELTKEALAYALICGVDLFLYHEKSGKQKRKMSGPLNRLAFENVQLFLRPMTGLWKNSDYGTDNLNQIGINEDLKKLLVLRKGDLPAGSEVSVSILDQTEDISWKLREDADITLRVAVVPLCHELVTKFVYDTGAYFHVEYTDEYNEKFKEIALKFLETAIERGCHVVVFPEFMISKAILQGLKNKLRKLDDSGSKTGNLTLVCAGSRWDRKGKNPEFIDNNISTLLDCHGTEIARQYKSIPYRSKDKRAVEKLDTPGKEVSLVDVIGLGRVQLSVCRDVCTTLPESNHKLIFSLFQPNLVLVPAWSGSIEGGFKEGFRDISVAGAVSVLGNCCEAVTFMLKQKGKDLSPRPQSAFRVFTGIPAIDDNSRIARVRCPYFSQEPCQPENCMITYDITIRKDEMQGEIFAVEDPVLIKKDGAEEKLQLWNS